MASQLYTLLDKMITEIKGSAALPIKLYSHPKFYCKGTKTEHYLTNMGNHSYVFQISLTPSNLFNTNMYLAFDSISGTYTSSTSDYKHFEAQLGLPKYADLSEFVTFIGGTLLGFRARTADSANTVLKSALPYAMYSDPTNGPMVKLDLDNPTNVQYKYDLALFMWFNAGPIDLTDATQIF